MNALGGILVCLMVFTTGYALRGSRVTRDHYAILDWVVGENRHLNRLVQALCEQTGVEYLERTEPIPRKTRWWRGIRRVEHVSVAKTTTSPPDTEPSIPVQPRPSPGPRTVPDNKQAHKVRPLAADESWEAIRDRITAEAQSEIDAISKKADR